MERKEEVRSGEDEHPTKEALEGVWSGGDEHPTKEALEV